MTEYDKEIVCNLNEEILGGNVKIIEKNEILNEFEASYNMGYNGINWGKNELILYQRIQGGLDDYLEKTENFLKKITNMNPSFLSQEVVVFGDSSIDLIYGMTFQTFLSLYANFLSLPQHTYIWFITTKECINFTFENEACFGKGLN